jgi:hypothetical protein
MKIDSDLIICPVCNYSVSILSASEFKDMDIEMIVKGSCHK